MTKIKFEIRSKLGINVRITENYWQKIVKTKHTVIEGKEELVKTALIDPDHIRVSIKDPDVYLFYKQLNTNYICVVVKHLNVNAFIITIYITDRIKIGKDYETN